MRENTKKNKPLMNKGKKKNKGFTLLEVLIAITIMTIATTSIVISQSAAINLSSKTKMLNTAVMLAKNKMIESEIVLGEKNFGELSKKDEGKFQEPYADFKWKREIKEIKFPKLNPNAGNEADEKAPQDTQGDQGGDAITGLIMDNVTKYLSESMREMTVTVIYDLHGNEYTYTITTYLIDHKAQFNMSLGGIQ